MVHMLPMMECLMDVFSPICVDDPMILSDPIWGRKEQKLAKVHGVLQHVFSSKARLKHSSIKFTLLYPDGSLAEEILENLEPTL